MADSSVVYELVNDLNYCVLCTWPNRESGVWEEDMEIYLAAKALFHGFDLRLI